MSDDLTRERRVSYEGEWEYKCIECLDWKDKERFGGCITFVDGFGNCLMCKECRYKNAAKKKKQTENLSVKNVLEAVGFYKYPDSESWLQAMMEKHSKR